MISQLYDLFVLYIMGYLGLLIAKKVRLPVSALLGPLLLLGGLRAFSINFPFPPFWFPLTIQLLLGIFLGLKFEKNKLAQIREMLIPLITMSVWALFVTFSLGSILFYFTPLDIQTAFLSASPGGLPEISVLAAATNADISVIVITHGLRMVSAVTVLPLLLKHHRETKEVDNKADSEIITINHEKNKKLHGTSIKANLLVISVGLAGGMLFNSLSIPAGALIGSLLAVMSVSILGIRASQPHHSFYTILLIGIGVMVSENFYFTFSSGLKIIPIVLVTLGYIGVASLGLAMIYRYMNKWDFGICLLASVPGGMTAMSVLAIDLDYDPIQITLLHLIRLLTIKLLLPLFFLIASYYI